jgi:hypothetical protein
MEGNLWRLSPLPHLAWAPKSIAGPFDYLPGDYMPYKNTWRYLLIYGIGWLFACGMVLGLRTRRDAIAWLVLVGINGLLMAGICIVHVAMGADKTLWMFTDVFDFTKSPIFFYKNHNGAYLAATMAAVLALAMCGGSTLRRRIWEIVAGLLWVATVAVNSRVATVTATLWGASYLFIRWKQSWRSGAFYPERTFVVAASLLCVLIMAGSFFPAAHRSVARFQGAFSNPGDFLRGGYFRTLIRHVGLEMWQDRPVFGWGGGAFLYLFNTYHTKVPEVAKLIYEQQPQLNRFYDVTANCDWIEGLVEYGLVGVGILSLAVALPIFTCLRRWREISPGTGFVMAGVVGLLFHAGYDYILRNPAILLLFLGLVTSMFRLSVPVNRSEASGVLRPDAVNH